MEKIYDIVVVGGGPAGLTAALYALRNGKDVLVIEKSVFGGQIVNSPKVENIPGFVSISGDEFGDLMLKQAKTQGGKFLFDEVTKIDSDDNGCTIYTDTQEEIKAKAVILATGTKHRKLNLDNEDNFIGKQIHFCAVCDGSFYKDKVVVMVGGGNSAFVEANILADIVDKLIILQDLPYFTAEAKLQEQVLAKKNIETHLNSKVLKYIIEDNKIVGINYLENNEEKVVKCDGIFLAIGLVPDNKAFTNLCDLDDRGYFKVDESTITKTSNVFVAGDCRNKSLRQVATACSDGANAAIAACNYLNNK